MKQQNKSDIIGDYISSTSCISGKYNNEYPFILHTHVYFNTGLLKYDITWIEKVPSIKKLNRIEKEIITKFSEL